MVGQEPKLFNGSVEENVRLGRCEPVSTEALIPPFDEFSTQHRSGCLGGSITAVKDPSSPDKATSEYTKVGAVGGGDIEMGAASSAVDSDIVEACKLSHAHEFVEKFPAGYATDVAEGSANISGEDGLSTGFGVDIYYFSSWGSW